MTQLPDRFQFVFTDDQSPSLRFCRSAEEFSESMHSLRGAFSETVYIYGAALSKAIAEKWRPEVLSLGLGLGYNEVLSAALLTAAQQAEDAYVESFESDEGLREYFTHWIRGDSSLVPDEFLRAYDEILQRCAQHAQIDPAKVAATLRLWLNSGQLVLRGPLSATTQFSRRFCCFLFDAFSSKSTPELWQEAFLIDFLSATAREHAVFSTYACTGALKRALRSSGFTLEIREGFSSKRDSTFAFR
ncbi:MAG: MnmC family methyltransferase [Bdellovibrionaceae bacterium]|nr:MnmC family methyltransferase [Pseudobdellovibrionaceae bacterium]